MKLSTAPSMFFLLFTLVVSSTSQAAPISGSQVLACETINTGRQIQLTVSREGNDKYAVEIISPDAFRPLAHLTVSKDVVFYGASLFTIDAWESRVGSLRLVVQIDVGSSDSKKVELEASYGRDAIRSDYGLTTLAQFSDDNYAWACTRN